MRIGKRRKEVLNYEKLPTEVFNITHLLSKEDELKKVSRKCWNSMII